MIEPLCMPLESQRLLTLCVSTLNRRATLQSVSNYKDRNLEEFKEDAGMQKCLRASEKIQSNWGFEGIVSSPRVCTQGRNLDRQSIHE